jgi:hypothetical protein
VFDQPGFPGCTLQMDCHLTLCQCRQADVVTDWIEQNLEGGKVTHVGFIGSSSWSSAYTYDTDSGAKYFVKTALGKDEGMFKGEALGLQAMYGVHHPPYIPRIFSTLDDCYCGRVGCRMMCRCVLEIEMLAGGSAVYAEDALTRGMSLCAETQTLQIPKVFHYGSLSTVPGGATPAFLSSNDNDKIHRLKCPVTYSDHLLESRSDARK